MPEGTLKGWKEVAAFLGTTERTAHRWERDFDLPVHRVPGARGALVFAHTAELESWRAGRQEHELAEAATPASEPSRVTRKVVVVLALAAIGGLAIAALLWAWQPWRPGGPSVAKKPGSAQASPGVTASGTSGDLVFLDLETGTPSSAMSLINRAGGLSSVTVEGKGTFGLISADRGGSLGVMVLSLAGGSGEARQIGSLRLARGTPVSFANGGVAFLLTWTGSRPSSAPAPKGGDGASKNCSITCDRITASAAAVETACGTCCDPSICQDTHWSRPTAPKH
jgi:hypothetical protein